MHHYPPPTLSLLPVFTHGVTHGHSHAFRPLQSPCPPPSSNPEGAAWLSPGLVLGTGRGCLLLLRPSQNTYDTQVPTRAAWGEYQICVSVTGSCIWGTGVSGAAQAPEFCWELKGSPTSGWPDVWAGQMCAAVSPGSCSLAALADVALGSREAGCQALRVSLSLLI